MPYVGRLFRPPSEADSFLLQVTVGCSHNRCSYCAMYRLPEQSFRPKNRDEVSRDIEKAALFAEAGLPVQRVFLSDGDALVLSTARLEDILGELRERVPTVRRVGIYGDARSILAKSVEELARLRGLGLEIVYHGVESGDDEVLRLVGKGSTRAEVIESGARLRAAGIRHSVIIMLGLGGRRGSRRHAEATASLLTELDPPYVGALVTTLIPGTELYEAASTNGFRLPDRWQMLQELRIILAESRFTRCRFSANHASNYLPLSLNLPVDRDRALALLDRIIEDRDDERLRPEYMRGL